MQATQIQPKNLNAQTVEHLGLRIVQGYYAVGQQLPIESQLCSEYGVSRPIVREATKILISKGLLNSKPRTGTIVQNRERWNLLDPDVLGWVTQSLPANEFLDMLFEARMSIEPFAAALAAQKATDQDLEKIAAAYADMAAAETIAESIEPDVRFHQAILDATHNEVIRYIGHTLHNALAISISLTSWDAKIYALSLPRHEAVYKAIAARDSVAANQAVCALLSDSRGDFDKQSH